MTGNMTLGRALLVEDKSLFGLKTIVGRLITAPGVKPVPKQQWECKYFDVYGIVEPKTGEEFFWEFSHLDQECFGRFLGFGFPTIFPGAEFHSAPPCLSSHC